MYQLPTITDQLTKTQIKIMSEHIIEELQNNGNIIQSADAIAKMELLIKEIRGSKEWVAYLREEVSKYGKDFTTSSGTKIELAEVGTKYDFNNCNDEILSGLLKAEEDISESVKKRKEFLKMLPVEGCDIITSEGEVVKIFPPSKTSTSSVKLSIQK